MLYEYLIALEELSMDNCTYRYIIVYDNENNLIYAECIKWLIGEFDTDVEFVTRPEKLGEGLELQFISSKNSCHTIDVAKKELCIQGKSLKFTVNEKDFISKRYDQPFNPLIDRCSKVEIFAKDETVDFETRIWFRNKVLPFEKLKEITKVDLFRNSELLNTFLFYEPTRIIVNSYFLDKRKNIGSSEPRNLEITFIDEFNHFNNANYVINAFKDGSLLESINGSISETVNLNLRESPDELEIQIYNDGTLIYDQRYFYIKKIEIGATISSGAVKLKDGNYVEKYTTENFSVGE